MQTRQVAENIDLAFLLSEHNYTKVYEKNNLCCQKKEKCQY